ncbi:MAG: MATE family efflux transporter [Fidelibacterota bacterium]
MNRPNKSSRLTDFIANPRKGLWSLAFPMMVGMMVQTVYSVVDMAFVGRVGAEAVTALAFNMPLVFFGLGLVFGLGTGVTAVVARYIGAQDKKGADNSAEHAVFLGLTLGLVFAAAGLSWGKPLLSILGTPPHILPQAWAYFSIIAPGYIFMVTSVFFRSILSGEGDTKTPMWIQGSGTVLNIGLDPLFIFVLGMGVRGAAVATVLSQLMVSAIFVYLIFVRKGTYVTFSLRDFSFSPPILRQIFRIGVPASFSMVIMSIGGGAFNRILVSFSGDAVAGYQIGQRIDHIFLMAAISIAAGLVTLVGMFRGASRMDLVRRITTYALGRVILIAVVLGTLFFTFAPEMVSIFTGDGEIQRTGVQYLRIFVFGYPFIAVSMTSGRVLQGLGFGLPMLVITILRVLLISVALASLFVFLMGKTVEWVWIAQVVAVVCSAAVAWIWLRLMVGRLERHERGVQEGEVSPVFEGQEISPIP